MAAAARPQFTSGIPTLLSEGAVSADMGRLSTPTTLMSSRDPDAPLAESIQQSVRDQVVVGQHCRGVAGNDEVGGRDTAGDVGLEGPEVDQLGVGTLRDDGAKCVEPLHVRP